MRQGAECRKIRCVRTEKKEGRGASAGAAPVKNRAGSLQEPQEPLLQLEPQPPPPRTRLEVTLKPM